ncbi:MAG: ABC transporter ATP-binding protein [Oscillospiraceae bacterium]|jgi:ABC-2 type transport system ATP-binding protein|nr:ABC transporter ATP-binding protein [Oscillospiraceae bacterium]
MIQVNNLTKKFGSFTALDNISCNINEGCIYGLVGSNGAGKSTFLRLITGIYKADGGTALLDGEKVYENPKMKNRFAFVPDELYFLPSSSMDRMSELYASIYSEFDKNRYRELANLFGLNTKLSINTFSKGMKRQAITILALASKPKYIFFDETFDGLDPVMRNIVKNIICNDVVQRKATAIISSHSLRELEDTCDQLALIHKGGLVLESDVQNLKTALFKVQIAFNEDYDITRFAGIEVLHFSKMGSVAKLIVRGEKEDVIARLKAMNPLMLDVLPLSLEEVFTYELASRGYSFEKFIDEVVAQ